MTIKQICEEYIKANCPNELSDHLEFNKENSGSLSTKFLNIRYNVSSNSIQFGWKKTFDRWANSIDWWTEIPETYNELVWLINYCEYLGASGKNNSGWGEEVKITMRDAKEHSKKLIKVLSIVR